MYVLCIYVLCMYVCMMYVCRLGIIRLPRKCFREISRLKFLLKFVDIAILVNLGKKKEYCT